jgi:hypothetical protein
MRTILFVTALGASAAAGGCSRVDPPAEAKPSAEAEVPSLSMDDVEKKLADKTIQAADCNHPRMRQKLGVLPGAILISSPDSFAAGELPADKTAALVFYCADPG